MSGLRTVVTTVGFWAYLCSSMPVLYGISLPIAVLSILTDKRRRLLHRYTSLWGYHYVSMLPLWTVSWEGREHLLHDEPAVIVANHQSLGDILVLFGLGAHYKWVSKAEIFRVPFIGWNMVANDYVGLVRGDRKSIQDMLDHCRRHLKAGSSIMIFPEGTRSKDGRMKAFKHGAFTLARDLGCPVVPVVVEGTKDALPKKSFVLRQPWGMKVKVSVLPAIRPRDGASHEALMARVREAMVTELARLRGRPVEEVVAPGTVPEGLGARMVPEGLGAGTPERVATEG